MFANKAVVSVLDGSVRAYRSHLVDTVAVGQGRVALAARLPPPNTLSVLQGVRLGTYGLGRVVDVTPALEGRLPVRALSVDGLRPANFAIPAHPMRAATDGVVRGVDGGLKTIPGTLCAAVINTPVAPHMGSVRTLGRVDDLFTGTSLLVESGALAIRLFLRDTLSVLEYAAVRAERLALRATLVGVLIVVESVLALGVFFFHTHAILELCTFTTYWGVVAHTSSTAVLLTVSAERRLRGHTNVSSLRESLLAFRLLLRHTVAAAQHSAVLTEWLFGRDADRVIEFLSVIADGLFVRDTPVAVANGVVRALWSGQNTQLSVELGSNRTASSVTAGRVLGYFDMVNIPSGWVLAGWCH